MDDFIDEDELVRDTIYPGESSFSQILLEFFPPDILDNLPVISLDIRDQDVPQRGPPGPEGTEYNFYHNKRGYAIIIHNYHFGTSMMPKQESNVDVSRLYGLFRRLQFHVKIFKNCSVDHVRDIISTFSTLDHTDADCFVCCVLSRGAQNCVWGTDGLITLGNLADSFKVCSSLVGKPKIFFIQADRGEEKFLGSTVTPNEDVGACSEEGSVGNIPLFPREADFLWVHDRCPGYDALINRTEGSLFSRVLADALSNFYIYTDNFLHVLTYINQRYNQENNQEGNSHNVQQCGSYMSTLTKDIYFNPKQNP